jgi:hypothetical protein
MATRSIKTAASTPVTISALRRRHTDNGLLVVGLIAYHRAGSVGSPNR